MVGFGKVLPFPGKDAGAQTCSLDVSAFLCELPIVTWSGFSGFTYPHDECDMVCPPATVTLSNTSVLWLPHSHNQQKAEEGEYRAGPMGALQTAFTD